MTCDSTPLSNPVSLNIMKLSRNVARDTGSPTFLLGMATLTLEQFISVSMISHGGGGGVDMFNSDV